MKNFFFTVLILTCSQGLTHAQTDVSISPFGLLIPVFVGTVEAPVADYIGLEGYLLAAEGGALLNVNGRYYLNPKRGYDGFNIGIFVGGGIDLGVGPGFSLGYKNVSERGVLFDVGFGLGRSLSNEWSGPLPYAKLNFGYRFQKKD